MVLRKNRQEMRNAALHPPRSGKSPSGWRVVSNANTTDASSARDAPANMAAIPTSAPMRRSIPARGAAAAAPAARTAPSAPPMVNNGASVPPEVPLPKEMHHETNFRTQRKIIARTVKSAERM